MEIRCFKQVERPCINNVFFIFIFNSKDENDNTIVKVYLYGKKYKYSFDKCYVIFKALGLDLFVGGIIKYKWVDAVKVVFEKGQFIKFKAKFFNNNNYNIENSNNNDAGWLIFIINAIFQVFMDSVFFTI